MVNLQFSCIKRLVKSYVMQVCSRLHPNQPAHFARLLSRLALTLAVFGGQVGLIETGLHLHPLKFYPGGPPRKARWGNNMKVHVSPTPRRVPTRNTANAAHAHRTRIHACPTFEVRAQSR